MSGVGIMAGAAIVSALAGVGTAVYTMTKSSPGSPDLAQTDPTLAQADAQRDIARAQRTRDVSVGIQYEHAGANANNSYSTTSYGLSVSVPLFINYD